MEHHNDLTAKARALEGESNWEGAAPLYETIVKEDPYNEAAIQRLLIIYRKLKQYKKEMQLLNASIKANAAKVKEQQAAWSKKHPKAARASRGLLQTLGNPKAKTPLVYEEPIVTTWRKRKENLAKKLEKK